MKDQRKTSHGDSYFFPIRLHARGWIAAAVSAVLAGILLIHFLSAADSSFHPAEESGLPRLWGVGVIPFVLILAAIAFLPLWPATMHWWEDNVNRLLVSLGCAVAVTVYVFATSGSRAVGEMLEHAIVDEYFPFLALLFALYVISGGIRLSGDLPATPWVNSTFLAVGALLASFIGTTGASMLLIRPLLQTNQERTRVLHTVIFFIFLVSNVGGCLLPIGDPPLFLGYLRGVPFEWTLSLLPEWAAATGLLLAAYYLLDRRAYKREPSAALARDIRERRPLRFSGMINFVWLAAVVAAVAFLVPGRTISIGGLSFEVFPYLREMVMLVAVILSIATTPQRLRDENQFSYHPILEVAALFIGIFVAMQVPVEVLHSRGAELGLSQPWHFFWATGSLSAFLDNAPTYVVFFETAATLPADPEASVTLANGGIISEPLLRAVSLGAVFMGAMTYIGNGPNFMVKSIAERAGIPMPSFFGFMLKFSLIYLIPTFLLVQLVFLL
jgi:Na+/H+ antiporter NhaD/arsenite permease-like protein